MEDLGYTGEEVEAAAPETSEESTQEAQMVPVDALQAERTARQQLQEELKVLRDHMTLMQSNQQQYRQPEPENSEDDEDVLTKGEAKKALKEFRRQSELEIAELRMAQKHSDYFDVINKYLPQVLKEDPSLRKSLEQTQDVSLAYHLAKNSEAYRNDHQQQKRSKVAEKIVENAQQPGNLSQLGQSAPVNSKPNWSSMTDEEFAKYAAKNINTY